MEKYCGKCGAIVPVGNGFCAKCGTMISMDIGTPPATQPVSNVVQTTQNQEQRRVTNWDGIISLVLFVVAIVSMYFSLEAATALGGFLALVSFGSLIGSVVFGISGICKKGAPKKAAVTGVVFSLCVVLFITICLVAAYNYDNNSGGRIIWDEKGIRYEEPWYEKIFD